MAANAVDFAGTLCGCRYEKELETHFRDCLLFYIDGRIRFERYCYGEAACLVFSLWANGLDETGKILWVKEPEFEVDQKAIPRVITDVQENGTAMQVDNQRKRYVSRAGVPAHPFILFTFISKRNCPRRTAQSGTSGGNFY